MVQSDKSQSGERCSVVGNLVLVWEIQAADNGGAELWSCSLGAVWISESHTLRGKGDLGARSLLKKCFSLGGAPKPCCGSHYCWQLWLAIHVMCIYINIYIFCCFSFNGYVAIPYIFLVYHLCRKKEDIFLDFSSLNACVNVACFNASSYQPLLLCYLWTNILYGDYK